MLRRNKTVKQIKISERKDNFVFEGGKYYVKSDKVLLMKKLFGFKPFLFFKEGISEPLGADNIQLIEDKETIFIDAESIHNLCSRDLLSVLAKSTMSKTALFTLVLLIVIVLLNVGQYA